MIPPQTLATTKGLSFPRMEFNYGQIRATGGLSNKALPMETRREFVGKDQVIYAKMSMTEPWLCRAVCGSSSVSNGGVGRTTLLKQLLDFVGKACDGDLESKAVRKEGKDADADGEFDPMLDVDGGDDALRTPIKTAVAGVSRGSAT